MDFQAISVKILPDGLVETMYSNGESFVFTTRSSGSSWTIQGKTYLPGTREFKILSKRVAKRYTKFVADMKFVTHETALFIDPVSYVRKSVDLDVFTVRNDKLSRISLRPGACSSNYAWGHYNPDGIYYGCGAGIPHIVLENRLAALQVERITAAAEISMIFSSAGLQDLHPLFTRYHDTMYPKS